MQSGCDMLRSFLIIFKCVRLSVSACLVGAALKSQDRSLTVRVFPPLVRHKP